MTSLLSLALLTALELLVVVARSMNNSAVNTADHLVEPVMSDNVDGCYVVTIFGLKTADCGKHSARSVPTSLDSDLQVQVYYCHVLYSSIYVYETNASEINTSDKKLLYCLCLSRAWP